MSVARRALAKAIRTQGGAILFAPGVFLADIGADRVKITADTLAKADPHPLGDKAAIKLGRARSRLTAFRIALSLIAASDAVVGYCHGILIRSGDPFEDFTSRLGPDEGLGLALWFSRYPMMARLSSATLLRRRGECDFG
jgi:hypothetical protein